MSAAHQLITDHLDIWTAADTEKKSGRGRASGNANSVYGIKKLRELILELAVRGKLVPQDPNDEPASELLKRIQAEQAKLIAEGQIKKSKVLPPVSDEEKSFELAPGWEWVRVGQVGHDWGQRVPDDDFTYIEVSAIDSIRGAVSSPEQVKPADAPSRARKIVKRGTIIYSTIRPYLSNIAVIEEDFSPEPIASTAFAIVHPFCAMPSRYFLYFFRSPVFVRYVESVQMGIAYPAINDGQFFSGIIPLPPLAEQHRIAAKVDELMALCDQLEAQHNNAADAHEQLVSHLLSTLTQSQDAADFNANWQRIATHFDTLFTTESSIDALKQTLLQLAVMGKLVPQDPNDEPASELLKRIQAEKAKLVKDGKNKKEKSFSKIAEDEKLFELPSNWQWVRFGEVNTIRSELVRPEDFLEFRQVAPDCIEKGTGQITEIRTVAESGVKGPNSRFYKGQIVYSKIRPSLSKAVLVDFDGLCSADMYPIETNIIPSFLLKQILSECFLAQVRVAENRIKMPKLNMESLTEFILAIPPLEEQHRIVTKIDELMTLCVQLKSRITGAKRLQQKLADVLVENAL